MGDILSFEGRDWDLLALEERPERDMDGQELPPPNGERRFGLLSGRLTLSLPGQEKPVSVDYTGGLLACRGLLHRYYSRAPWSYQDSCELTFDQGRLVSVSDAASAVRAVRELLYRPEGQEDLLELAERVWWVRACLGLTDSGSSLSPRRGMFL